MDRCVDVNLIFQSTLPRGERRPDPDFIFRNFNPRSHEGSDLFQLLTSQGLLYFNPRSHEGSDIDEAQLLFNSRISIHAPTRGATCLCLDKYRLIHISIHAPTRGATTGSGNLFGDSIISIHAPTRGATPMLQLRYSRKPISIHAPTRGATSAVLLLPVATSNFNPRSHEGSDLRQSASTCQKSFQSTLPRGERQAADSIQARKGIISIHAPTRGATKQYRAKTNVNAKFQSTLPRGERQISTYPVLWRQKFQSTLPRGERLPVQINILPALFISIHAPTRGATIARVEQ